MNKKTIAHIVRALLATMLLIVASGCVVHARVPAPPPVYVAPAPAPTVYVAPPARRVVVQPAPRRVVVTAPPPPTVRVHVH